MWFTAAGLKGKTNHNPIVDIDRFGWTIVTTKINFVANKEALLGKTF